MHLVGVQIDIAWENRAANHARVRDLLDRNPPPAGALVALPEMFASGFSMNVASIADDAGETERFVRETAKRHGIHLIAGRVKRGDDDRGRNEAIVAGP